MKIKFHCLGGDCFHFQPQETASKSDKEILLNFARKLQEVKKGEKSIDLRMAAENGEKDNPSALLAFVIIIK